MSLRWILRSRGNVDLNRQKWATTCDAYRVAIQQRMAAGRALEWIGTSKVGWFLEMKYHTCWPVWLISSSQLSFPVLILFVMPCISHLVLEIKLINDKHHVACTSPCEYCNMHFLFMCHFNSSLFWVMYFLLLWYTVSFLLSNTSYELVGDGSSECCCWLAKG